MLFLLAALTGVLGVAYLTVKTKLPWLPRDLAFLKKLITFAKEVDGCMKKGILAIDIFEKTADKFADKAMIIHKDNTYSFTEIERMANKVANMAISLGFKQGDTVAILMYNEPAFIWTWFGFQKLGVEVAFINFHQRKKVLLHSITVSGAKAVFLNTGLELYTAIEDVSPDLQNVQLYTFDDNTNRTLFKRLNLTNASEQRVSRKHRSNAGFHSTNCLIFTSGTTGLPKSAIVTNKKVVATLFVYNYVDVTSDDILYEPLPMYHSAAALLGLGTTIRNGITMVLAERFSASKYFEDCYRYNVTLIHYVGEMCRYLVSTPEGPYDTKHKIRVALGNGLRKDIWATFQERFKVPSILEFYGATELPVGFINIDNTVGSVGRVSPLLKKLYKVSFVKFDTFMDTPVRDEKGRCVLAKPGEPGLLIIKRGEMTPFEGYKNKEDATKKKLLHDVFVEGDVHVNSGDLFYFDDKYNLYFYDRLGDTFRWKGENVSTTEISNIISELPFIADTCVYGVSVPGCEGRAGMAALQMNESAKDLSIPYMVSEIQEKCTNELAAYAIPRFLRFRQELDVTSTFKQQKGTLKKEGFDISLISDPVYYFNTKQKKFCLLDKDAEAKISKQEIPI